MKRIASTTLLVFVVVVGVYAGDNHRTPPAGQNNAAASSEKDGGDIQPLLAAPADKPRAVSQEGIAYLQKLRKNTPFGTADFNLEQLRSGMGSRREPAVKNVSLIRLKIGEIPVE